MGTFLRRLEPIIILVALCLLLGTTSGTIIADKGSQPGCGNNSSSNPPRISSVINVTDSSWSNSSETSDCAQGWGNDEWRLTLSQPKTVRIRVDDCCCPGDYYSIFVNGNRLGTTPHPAVWGCDYSGSLSSGTFDMVLPAGTHAIKVRDVSFPEHTAQEIAYAHMCPAGFSLSGTLLPPPSFVDISLTAVPWQFGNDTSPYLPERMFLTVTAKNLGTATANNVLVRFYSGNPDQGGPQIGPDQAIGSVLAGSQASATVEWTLNGNVENRVVYARAFVASDSTPANNTTSQPVSIWYVPFHLDRDAFSFTNWGLEPQDVLNDLLSFLDIAHPDEMSASLLSPIIYPFLSVLLENAGHCYGMAAASSLYYQYPEIKPIVDSTYGMTKDETRNDIQYYHRTQTSHMLEAIMMKTFGADAVAEYNTVRSSIRDRQQPIMLLMQTSAGGHAVLGYKMLDLGDEKRIYIYDNNLPVNNMFTGIYATVNTKTRTFLYDSSYGYRFDRALARPAELTVPDNAKVVVKRFYNWVLEQVLGSGLIRVSIAPSGGGSWGPQAASPESLTPTALTANPLITDQYGRRIGYVGGTFVNEIPGAMMTQAGNEKVLDVPGGLRYTVNANGTGSGHVALAFLIPEGSDVARTVGYFDVPVAAGSTASVQLRKGNTNWTLTNSGQPPRQPDALQDTRYYKTFMPVTLNDPTCGGQAFANNGFEQGSGVAWSRTSAQARSLIYPSGSLAPVTPHTGSWAGWLGGAHNEVANLYQTVNLPASATSATLSYWYWIRSDESGCSYDHAWVEVNGGLLKLHDLCSSGNTYGWSQAVFDLTPYIGQPLELRFHTDTDFSLVSSFYVDAVSLDISCSAP